MKLEQVIRFFGSRAAVYEALGVTKAAVSQWAQSGIPPLRQYQIEVVSKGKLKADRRVKEAA